MKPDITYGPVTVSAVHLAMVLELVNYAYSYADSMEDVVTSDGAAKLNPQTKRDAVTGLGSLLRDNLCNAGKELREMLQRLPNGAEIVKGCEVPDLDE